MKQIATSLDNGYQELILWETKRVICVSMTTYAACVSELLRSVQNYCLSGWESRADKYNALKVLSCRKNLMSCTCDVLYFPMLLVFWGMSHSEVLMYRRNLSLPGYEWYIGSDRQMGEVESEDWLLGIILGVKCTANREKKALWGGVGFSPA